MTGRTDERFRTLRSADARSQVNLVIQPDGPGIGSLRGRGRELGVLAVGKAGHAARDVWLAGPDGQRAVTARAGGVEGSRQRRPSMVLGMAIGAGRSEALILAVD